jgi:AcrR family transcriptional regulator
MADHAEKTSGDRERGSGARESELRADARANHDKVLGAAAALFAEEGADRSMTAIAKRAGVGAGTLYRRFSTREELVEAVHRNETTQLAESAESLLSELGPRQGLREWMNGFLTYMAAKEGMADALPSILRRRHGLKTNSRDALRNAIAMFLEAGAADGSLRDDFDAEEVMMALGGIALIASYEGRRVLGDRLLTLLIDGLSVH